MKKNQSKRLTEQHKESHGVIGIFGEEAQQHDHDADRCDFNLHYGRMGTGNGYYYQRSYQERCQVRP